MIQRCLLLRRNALTLERSGARNPRSSEVMLRAVFGTQHSFRAVRDSMRCSVVLGLLVLGPASLAVAAPPAVLSVTGTAHLEGQPLRQGMTLSAGQQITLAWGAVLQILLNPTLVATLAGRTQARVSSAGLHLEEKYLASLAGSGHPGVLEIGPWRIVLDADGAAVLVSGDRCFVLEGQATVGHLFSTLAEGNTPPGQPPSPQALSSRLTLRSGQSGRMLLDGTILVESGSPAAQLLGQLRIYQVPSPWNPPLGQISAEDVQRAMVWHHQQQQAQREAASCGCTESRSGGAGPLAGHEASGNPLEKINTRIKVHLGGLPRKIH